MTHRTLRLLVSSCRAVRHEGMEKGMEKGRAARRGWRRATRRMAREEASMRMWGVRGKWGWKHVGDAAWYSLYFLYWYKSPILTQLRQVGVNGGVVAYECSKQERGTWGGGDMLLEDDERRSERFARAAEGAGLVWHAWPRRADCALTCSSRPHSAFTMLSHV